MQRKPQNASEKSHTFNDSLAIAAFAVSLLSWAIAPSAVSRIAALLVAALISSYLAYKSHFTKTFTARLKHGLAFLVVLAIGTAGYIQWRQQVSSRSEANQKTSVPVTMPVDTTKLPNSLPQKHTVPTHVKVQSAKAAAPIKQTAKDSTCSNVVAGGDVTIVCPPTKEEK